MNAVTLENGLSGFFAIRDLRFGFFAGRENGRHSRNADIIDVPVRDYEIESTHPLSAVRAATIQEVRPLPIVTRKSPAVRSYMPTYPGGTAAAVALETPAPGQLLDLRA